MNKSIFFIIIQLIAGVLAIISYFKHWTVLFYIISAIIAFLWIILLIVYLWAADSMRQKLYYIILSFIYWEVGYLITGSFFDGLLFGICLSPIVGVFEHIISRIRNKKNGCNN